MGTMTSSVGDLMTADVVSVRSGASYKQVAATLAEHDVSAVPVIDITGRVIGVISETDLLAREALAGPNHSSVWELLTRRGRAARLRARAVSAGMLMSAPPVTVTPAASPETAARLMWRHDVNRLPVVDGHGLLVGIIARGDLLTRFLRPDAEIRDEVFRRLGQVMSDDARHVEVRVLDGIVTLSGVMSVGAAFRAVDVTREIEGVVDVVDDTDYFTTSETKRRNGGGE